MFFNKKIKEMNEISKYFNGAKIFLHWGELTILLVRYFLKIKYNISKKKSFEKSFKKYY